MSIVPRRVFVAFGVVLGAFCAGRRGDAQVPKGTGSAPSKASAAATVGAPHEAPPDQEPATGFFGGRPPRGRTDAQSATPSEPLVVLKSGPDHVRLVWRLKHHPATNASTTITHLLRQEGELSASSGTAAKGKPVLRVAISPEVITNSLIISGPPEAVEEVRMLAEKLDQPPPQVQFEMEMGEVAAGEAKHGESLASDRSALPAARQGTYYILERPKTMKTLARAGVLTLDNQAANVQMGERVPEISSLMSNWPAAPTPAKGIATPRVTYQNVGLMLAVTPRINVKDGIVVLQVAAEDSQLGPEDEGIPVMVADNKVIRSPRIETISVQTTVTIPDGKTIIIGSAGRMGKTDKELVIVLTPHIIRPEDGKKMGQ